MLSKEHARLSPTARGALFYFGFFAAQAANVPFINVFFAHQGFSGSEIGLLAAVGPLTALIVAPALTALADRRGWRVRLLSLGLAGMALTTLAIPFATSFAWLLVVVAVLAAVGSPVGSIADGLIAHMSKRRGLSFGKMRLWGSLSWATIAALGGALWQKAGLFLMFPVASFLLLVTIPSARLLEEPSPTEAGSRPSLRTVMRDRRLAIVLIATLILGLALTTGSTFTGVYVDKLSGGQLLVGLFAGVTAATELPVMHWSEGIMRRLSGPWTLVLGYAAYAASYMGLALVQSPPLLLVVAVVQGVGYGLFLTATIRLVVSWTPAEWSSTAQGVLNAGLWGLAPLIAGPLGGAIYDTAGPATVFVVCAGIAAVAMAVLIVSQLSGAFKERAEHQEEADALENRVPTVVP